MFLCSMIKMHACCKHQVNAHHFHVQERDTHHQEENNVRLEVHDIIVDLNESINKCWLLKFSICSNEHV